MLHPLHQNLNWWLSIALLVLGATWSHLPNLIGGKEFMPSKKIPTFWHVQNTMQKYTELKTEFLGTWETVFELSRMSFRVCLIIVYYLRALPGEVSSDYDISNPYFSDNSRPWLQVRRDFWSFKNAAVFSSWFAQSLFRHNWQFGALSAKNIWSTSTSQSCSRSMQNLCNTLLRWGRKQGKSQSLVLNLI